MTLKGVGIFFDLVNPQIVNFSKHGEIFLAWQTKALFSLETGLKLDK